MRTDCQGILAIWHDVAAGQEPETLAWYDRQHHPERVAVPGFLSARRYAALRGGPRIFIRYETRDPGVLASPAYLERLNQPTEWSLRCQPNIINNSRTVCRVAARSGRAEGGFVATFRFDPPAGADPAEVVGWTPLLQECEGRRGTLALELWVADRERSALDSREKELRGIADHVTGAALIAHGSAPEPLVDLLEPWRQRLAGATGAAVAAGLYGLAYALDAERT
ncbi:MAG TPA: hypothetical protein VFZ01_16275 [Geminicoccaceae bacterium]